METPDSAGRPLSSRRRECNFADLPGDERLGADGQKSLWVEVGKLRAEGQLGRMRADERVGHLKAVPLGEVRRGRLDPRQKPNPPETR